LTLGYFIRDRAESWRLIRVCGRASEEIVADGLSYEEAVAMYWRKLEELARPQQGELGL
jgi:hypothetical protein